EREESRGPEECRGRGLVAGCCGGAGAPILRDGSGRRSTLGLVRSVTKAKDHGVHAGLLGVLVPRCSSETREPALVWYIEGLQRDEVVGAVDEDEVALSACQVGRVGAFAPVPAVIDEADDAVFSCVVRQRAAPDLPGERSVDPKLRALLALLHQVNLYPLLRTQLLAFGHARRWLCASM